MTRNRITLLLGALLLAQSASGATIIPVFSNLWSVAAGVYPDLPAGAGNVRGASISPITTNVLFASTTGGTNNGNNHVAVLDATNSGAYIGQLNASGVSGGLVNLVPVRMADDGFVYACNVAGAGGSLRIYQWPSESDMTTVATVIEYAGAPTRWGDYMDVRGGGLNTEILVVGSGANSFVIFKPADETLTTWTNTVFAIPGGATTWLTRGATFEGNNNAIYAKETGTTTIRRIAYDHAGPTVQVTASFAADLAATAGLDFAEVDGVKLLTAITYGTTATTNTTTHRIKVFQLTGPSNAVVALNNPIPEPYSSGNGNGLGITEIRNGRAIFGEPGHALSFYSVSTIVSNVPPYVTLQPVGNTNVLRGGYYTLSVSAGGEEPLDYYWLKDGSPLPGANGSSLMLTNVTLADSGDYSVIVSNFVNGGSTATSAVVTIGVIDSVLTPVATKLWQKPVNSLSFLLNDNRTRGLAYHALSNRVAVASRGIGTGIYLLDADNGSLVGNLDMTGVVAQPGANSDFLINMVGVAEDGAIYACNLTSGSPFGGFTIYRWADADPATIPTVAYGPDAPLGERIGDTFSVVGSGVNTRILAASRNGTKIAVFTTGDGVSFSPNVVDVATAPAGFAGLGLAAAAGSTFWATAPTVLLHKVFYDLENGTNEVQAVLGGQSGYNIGVDVLNELVAAIGTADTPANLRILDVYQQSVSAPLLDQEFFGSDNDNIGGTGAVAFDVTGGRIFALDTNNGLLAVKYAPPIRVSFADNNLTMTWSGPAVLQHSTVVTGGYTNVPGATSSFSTSQPGYYRLQH